MEADQTTKSYFVIYVNQKSAVVQVLLALKERDFWKNVTFNNTM